MQYSGWHLSPIAINKCNFYPCARAMNDYYNACVWVCVCKSQQPVALSYFGCLVHMFAYPKLMQKKLHTSKPPHAHWFNGSNFLQEHCLYSAANNIDHQFRCTRISCHSEKLWTAKHTSVENGERERNTKEISLRENQTNGINQRQVLSGTAINRFYHFFFIISILLAAYFFSSSLKRRSEFAPASASFVWFIFEKRIKSGCLLVMLTHTCHVSIHSIPSCKNVQIEIV